MSTATQGPAAFRQAALALAAAFGPDQVGEAITRLALDGTGATRVGVFTVHAGATWLEIARSAGGPVTRPALALADATGWPTEAVAGMLAGDEAPRPAAVDGGLVIRLAAGGPPVGALYLEGPGVEGFGPALAELAPLMAIALENTWRLDAERREAAHALRESDRRYRNLYVRTPVMMHSIDQEGRLVAASDAWLETLGYAWDEVVGRRSTEFLTPESRRHALEHVLPAFYRTGKTTAAPYQFVRKDGTVLDTLLSATAERDAEGRVLRSLAVIIDVTAMRRAEAERQFLGAITHELRTPLTSILGYAEFLEEVAAGVLPDRHAAFIEQIKRAARRLSLLVDDMLDVARLDAGTFALRREPTDVGQRIADHVESLRPQMREAGLALAAAIPDDPLVLPIDPHRVGQVVLNLVGNAIKFSHAGGAIAVRVIAEPDAVRFEVEDQGPGIAPEDLPRLFQRHGQLEEGRRKPRGTGLGLFIGKAIVEAHGGAIGVRSVPGAGSTFWFTLPRA